MSNSYKTTLCYFGRSCVGSVVYFSKQHDRSGFVGEGGRGREKGNNYAIKIKVMDIIMNFQSNGKELKDRIEKEGITDIDSFIKENLSLTLVSSFEKDHQETR